MLKICRLCFRECLDYECLEIFSNELFEQNIAAIISKYFWFKPSKNDNYSQLICTKCWTRLKDFHNFYQDIQRAQDIFHKSLKIEDSESSLDPLESLVKIETTNNDKYSNTEEKIPIKKLETTTANNIFDPLEIILKTEPDLEISEGSFDLSNKNNDNQREKQNDIREQNEIKEDYSNQRIDENDDNKKEQKILKLEIKKSHQKEEDCRIREFFKLKCEICQEKFLRFCQLCRHYKQSHSIKNGFVTCCNRKLQKRSSLLEHLDWHSNPDAFRCKICTKQCRDKWTLKLHMSFHAPEENRIFRCDICGKGYDRKCGLRQHLSYSHKSNEDKNFKCQKCEKAFLLRTGLTAHIRTVHELAEKAVCHICAKVFATKGICETHIQLEHGEPNQRVECTICGIWLKNKFTYYHHMRHTHNGIAQKCETCNKEFSNRVALTSHIRYVHDLKPKHKCSFCDKTFKSVARLKDHQATHTGIVPNTCPYCKKTFNSNSNMHTHRKRSHPDEWLRDRNIRKFGTPTEIRFSEDQEMV